MWFHIKVLPFNEQSPLKIPLTKASPFGSEAMPKLLWRLFSEELWYALLGNAFISLCILSPLFTLHH